MTARLLVNVDVPDLKEAIAFYCGAFGLSFSRHLGEGVAELRGWPVPLYLLEKPEGSVAAAHEKRHYRRHWTSVHFDIVVDDLESAVARAGALGASLESGIQSEAWGRIATLSDPFGNGLCLLQFAGRGYGEIESAVGKDG